MAACGYCSLHEAMMDTVAELFLRLRFTVYDCLVWPNLDILRVRFMTAFTTLLGEEITLAR